MQFSFNINRLRFSFFMFCYRLMGLGITLKILEIGERGLVQHYSEMLQNPQLSNSEKYDLIHLLERELRHEEAFADHTSKFNFFLRKVATINSQLSNGLVTILSIASGFAGLFVNPFDVVKPSLIMGFTGAIDVATSRPRTDTRELV